MTGFAAAVAAVAGGGNASMRVATVTDFDQAGGLVTARVAEGTLVACPYLSSYVPTVDDNILMLSAGGAWVVLGSVGVATPPLSPQVASILTKESTSSASYVDLATPGPSITVSVPATGRVLVHFAAQIGWFDNTVDGADGGAVSIALSGANTIAASNDWNCRAYYQPVGTTANAGSFQAANFHLFTGLAQGETTFMLKYMSMATGKSVDFQRRSIAVIPC